MPHDIKVHILKSAPDMSAMLALTSAYPGFMTALKDAPRATMTKVVMRQLVANGFDINHPLLDLQHYLQYPDTLEWNNDGSFTAGLKALREVVLRKRKLCFLIIFIRNNADAFPGETMTLQECFILLGEGYDKHYFYWLITRIRDLLDQAEAGN